MANWNFIWSVFRRGDLGDYKDMQCVGIVDPNDYPTRIGKSGQEEPDFDISDRMHEIFVVVEIPWSKKSDALAKIKAGQRGEDGTLPEFKWVLNSKKFSKELNGKLYKVKDGEKSATKDLIKGLKMETEQQADSYLLYTDKFEKVKDVNAIAGGACTIGSAGTYAAIELLIADLAATLTSNLTATIISDITISSQSTLSIDLGGFTFAITDPGMNYTITWDHDGNIINNSSSNGVFFLNHVHIKSTASVVINSVILSLAGSGTTTLYRCYLEEGGGTTFLVRQTNSNKILHVLSCMTYGTIKTLQIDANDGNASSVYANNTSYMATGSAFTFANNAGICYNNVAYGTTVGFVDTGNLSVFLKCATSGANGSEPGLSNRTAAVDMQSTNPLDANFLYPTGVGVLSGTGINPTIPGYTEYLNSVPIVTGDVDIGAYGLPRVTLSTSTLSGTTLTCTGSGFLSPRGTGKIEVSPTGAGTWTEVDSYTSWVDGLSVAEIAGLDPGIYDVKLTNSDGLTATKTVDFTVSNIITGHSNKITSAFSFRF